MLVYVLGRDARGLYGFAVGEGLEQCAEFAGIDRLVLLIDEMCENRGDVPQGFGEMRGKCGDASQDFEAGGVFMKLGRESYAMRYRAKELLQITVTGRRNAGLQGRMKGMCTNGKYVHFCSALELIRMLDAVPV